MFTGIVKSTGRIAASESRGGDLRLRVTADGIDWSDFTVGESISVNGVCLTAVTIHDDGFDTDVSGETLRITALAGIGPGTKVNLEPAISLGERLGGHLVSGHVDCVGTVIERTQDARSIRFGIEIPEEFMRYVARKGSVCIDGVSLTINEVSGNGFSVNIIPHTASATIIDGYQLHTKVNIEVDLLARYLERLIQNGDDGVSLKFLKAHGYA